MKPIAEIIAEMNLGRMDYTAVEKLVHESISECSEAVEDYLAGKDRALYAVVGHIKKKSNGKADARDIVSILKNTLRR